MILIISDVFDAHADEVTKHLSAAKEPFFRLNLDVETLKSTKIHFQDDIWHVTQNGTSTTSQEINCVWPRRLTVSLTLEQQTTEEESDFKLWKSEWNRCLYGFYAYLRHKFWMNPIQASGLMDNKFYQMKFARSIGFDVPDYISSNDKDKIQRFVSKNETVAIKFMSQDIYKMPDGSFRGIYVNRVSNEELEDFREYSENPITLQCYVDKAFEVRHTYVDGQHYACKIESQLSDVSNIDWRRYDIANTPHSKINPPEKIINLINSIMNEAGLYYGAFDFIVDSEGKWWYLEVNTSGQWLWIEDLVGHPISARVAESLSIRSKGEC